MKKIEKIITFMIGCLCCFMIGAYTDAVIFRGESIEIYRWAIMVFFLVYFFSYSLTKNKEQ